MVSIFIAWGTIIINRESTSCFIYSLSWTQDISDESFVIFDEI